jgi:NRPS condensation-like uncharacterized protein
MKRLASYDERCFLFYGQRYPINFSHYLKLKGSLSQQDIRRALHAIRKKHAIVFTRLIDESDGLKSISTTGVAETKIVEIPLSDQSWTDVIQPLLNEPFNNEEGPFLRIGLRTQNEITELFFVFQHSVADAIGAVYLIQDLLKAVAGQFEWSGPLSLPELCICLKKEIATELADTVEFTKGYNFEPIAVAADIPTIYPNYLIHTLSLNSEELTAFCSHSKDNGLTVHSFLGAILLKSSAEIYGANSTYIRKIRSPVNLRPYIQEQTQTRIGLFISSLQAEIDCSPDQGFFQIGSDIQKKFKALRENYRPLEYGWSAKHLGSQPYLEKFLSTLSNTQRPDYDFSLSNIGKLDWSDNYGDLVLEDIFGPIVSSVYGAISIGVNSSGGKMNINLIYDRDYRDDNQTQMFIEAIHKNIHFFVKNPSKTA